MASKTLGKIGFHATSDYERVKIAGWVTYKQESKFTYTFENFFHPFVGELIERLNTKSLPGMLDPAFHEALEADFFTSFYSLQTNQLLGVEYFPKQIDVSVGGPYANYNWELLFHVPLTIAVHLSKNQRFAEAQRWFHYVFNPTANDTSVPVPQRYWNFIAFRRQSAGQQIDELLALLSKPASECTDQELDLKAQILAGYQAITDQPFQPHVVARTRPVAYMYSVVMKYLDNLVAWGDQLFRQDTLESINEATQLYVLAANILGERPQKIPLKGTVRPKTFAELRSQGLDALGNALVELEGAFPFNLGVPSGAEAAEPAAPLFGIGRTLYFCIPRNDKMLGYWDIVADRLFKIRNCMNIEGVLRPLALFDPPLDPGMLVKAAAGGIDIGAIVAGLNQPVGPARAQLFIQKALELCGEVRNLGSSLLQVIEKADGERLALLRQGHEIKIHQLQQEVRFLQWKQAQETTESLLRTRAIVLERYKYYLRLLGLAPDSTLAPDTFALDRRELSQENFDEAYAALVGQYDREVPVQEHPKLSLAGGGTPAGEGGAESQGSLALVTSESDELSNLSTARDVGLAASIVDATGTAMVFIPDINADLHYWGLGGTMKIKIGTAILKVLEITAKILQMTAAWHRDQAGIAARTSGFQRRADDWLFQANVAARELRQIGRQIISSLLSEQIAHREYTNVQQLIENAQEVDRFLRDKFSNAQLYTWMQGELSRLYYEYYRFAFDIARRAEQTLKRELMRPELDAKTLVKFNYWDGGRKGLLSGEALYLDVKRMEMAYHDHNRREYALTKHVSLMQVDPLAVISLRVTGRCTVRLPEVLFDLDCPGHYCRSIKSVALSIPCLTGPYVSVNCKLTLLKSSIRTSPLLNSGYPREGLEDTRFVDSFAGAQSIVTSVAQQDSGLFETKLGDERYLPFENAGVLGEWQLELPGNPSEGDPTQFDYSTISDVILHIRYTARDGGAPLRTAALQQVKDLIASAEAAGSVRLFSMRHEFPTEWARFTSQTPAANQRYELRIRLRPEHYPFWSQNRLTNVLRVDLLAERAGDPVPATIDVADRADKDDASTLKDALTKDPSMNDLLVGKLQNVPRPAEPAGELTLYFDDAKLNDLFVAVTWSG
jgi:hypothetical protein